MDLIARRVASRFLTAAPELEEWDFGRFHITADPKARQLLEEALGRADKAYSQAGFPLGKKVDVRTGTRSGGAAYFVPRGNYIEISSRVIRIGALFEGLVHELAHWFHYNRLPGGFNNEDVWDKHDEIIEGRGGPEAPFADLDQLKKKLTSLKRKRTALFKKISKAGKFNLPGYEDRIGRSGKYVREVRTFGVQPMRGGQKLIKMEIFNPSPSDLEGNPQKSLSEGGIYAYVPVQEVLPGLPTLASAWDKLDAEIRETEDAISTAHNRDRTTDRYQTSLDDWMPTEYGKTDVDEWLAELLTMAVLGRVSKPVLDWLKSLA
jgi:hypothetical protein